MSLLIFFLVRHGQKWMRPVWSCESKDDWISVNRWNKPIFCMLVQILKVAPERFKVASMFFSLYLKNEYMN